MRCTLCCYVLRKINWPAAIFLLLKDKCAKVIILRSLLLYNFITALRFIYSNNVFHEGSRYAECAGKTVAMNIFWWFVQRLGIRQCCGNFMLTRG